MRVTNPVRIYRKIIASGLRETVVVGWNSIYTNKILKKYYLRHHSCASDENIISRDELENEANSFWSISNSDGHCQKIPVRDEISTEENFDSVSTRQIACSRVYEFQQGWLLGPSGLGFTWNNQPIVDTVGLPPAGRRRVAMALANSASVHGIRWLNDQVQANSKEKFYSTEVPVATAIIPLWNNYYHWLIECLPRLRYINRYQEITGREVTVFIPESRTSWQNDLLNQIELGLNYQSLSEKAILANRLVVPVYPDPSPEDAAWLRSRLLQDNYGYSTSNRIYISRDDATSRRIRNKDEVRTVLDKYDIKEYVLTDLSVQKQAHLFANADLIVSPHGAGLANIVFCDNETTLIELFGDEKRTSYYRISSIIDIEYNCLSGESSNTDIIVNVPKLINLLDSVTN